jgi:hypothetical protein
VLGIVGGIDRSGIGNPGHIRLSLVGDERFVVSGDVLKYGPEPGVIHHDVAPVVVLQFHPDIFPDLDCDGAVREFLICEPC